MITNSSLINPSAMLDANKWGVTLTVDKWDVHARLIFEGVENDNYFYQIAHLMGPGSPGIVEACMPMKGCVHISEPHGRERFRSNYAKKSPTWIASKERIQNLISEIQREQGQETPFHICGNESILSRALDVFHIYNPVLAAIKNQDPYLFISLYDSAQNDGKYTGMNEENFNSSIASTFAAIGVNTLSYADLIQLVNTSVEKHSLSQDSCFTWSLRKLKKIGVEMPEGVLKKIVYVTRFYITHNPDEDIQPIECDPDITLDVQRFQREAFYEKYVTYATERDKRTHDYKMLEHKVEINDLQRLSIEGITVFGVACAALCLGPITAVVSGVGIVGMAFGFESKLLATRNNLIDEKVGMNQLGNKNWDSLKKTNKPAYFQF